MVHHMSKKQDSIIKEYDLVITPENILDLVDISFESFIQLSDEKKFESRVNVKIKGEEDYWSFNPKERNILDTLKEDSVEEIVIFLSSDDTNQTIYINITFDFFYAFLSSTDQMET